MKKYILILVLLGFLSEIKAQYLDNVPCPVLPNTGNSFDWRAPSFEVFMTRFASIYPNGFQIASPFFARNTPYGNPNINHFDMAWTTWRDFNPDEGWVFVKKDFGQAASPEKPAVYVNHPHLILYNKFTGLLRIFIAIGATPAVFNKAMVRVRMTSGSYTTAILDLYNSKNYVNTLSEVILPNEATFTQEYATNLPYWVYGDFSMAYDPCTCNTSSKLDFDVILVQSSTLSFSTKGSLIADIDNTARTQDGGIFPLIKQRANSTLKAIDAVNGYYEKTSKAISTIKRIFNIAESNKSLKVVERIIPGASLAIGAVSFLLGGGSSDEKPKPVNYKVDLQSSGQIELQAPHGVVNMDMPGSYTLGGGSIDYKNVMGVFNVLSTPIMDTYRARERDFGIPGLEDKVFLSIRPNVEFAINPAAEIKLNPKVLLAFEFEMNAKIEPAYISGILAQDYIIESDSSFRSSYMPLHSYYNDFWLPNCNVKTIFDRTFTDLTNFERVQHYVKFLVEIEPLNGSKKHLLVFRYKIQKGQNFIYDPIRPFRIKPPFPKEDILLQNSFAGNIGITSVNANIYVTNELKLDNMRIINANLRAGEKVLITGETLIEATSTISSGYRFIYNDFPSADPNSINLVTNQRLSQFCQSNNYRAGRLYLREWAEEANEISEQNAETFNTLTAFPNPTKSDVKFSYVLEQDEDVLLYVSNIMGEKIAVLHNGFQEKGKKEIIFPTKNLPAGIYLYTVETSQHRITKRLVIVK